MSRIAAAARANAGLPPTTMVSKIQEWHPEVIQSILREKTMTTMIRYVSKMSKMTKMMGIKSMIYMQMLCRNQYPVKSTIGVCASENDPSRMSLR